MLLLFFTPLLLMSLGKPFSNPNTRDANKLRNEASSDSLKVVNEQRTTALLLPIA